MDPLGVTFFLHVTESSDFRRSFTRAAINSFLRSHWPSKQLIVLNGTTDRRPLLDNWHDQVTEVVAPSKSFLVSKDNIYQLCKHLARYPWIGHMRQDELWMPYGLAYRMSHIRDIARECKTLTVNLKCQAWILAKKLPDDPSGRKVEIGIKFAYRDQPRSNFAWTEIRAKDRHESNIFPEDMQHVDIDNRQYPFNLSSIRLHLAENAEDATMSQDDSGVLPSFDEVPVGYDAIQTVTDLLSGLGFSTQQEA